MEWTQEIQTILANQNENGGPFWSRDDEDIYHPMGHSTIETLGVLGELGARETKYPVVSEAIDFVFERQTADGSFKYSSTSSKLPCMTAHVLSALGRLKAILDIRTEKSYRQLLDTQWTDGGWRCTTVKFGKSPETDASNPGKTLYVLDAFRFRENNTKEIDQLNRGVEFLLKHWETRKPIGPCDFGMGSRFFQIEFPFLRYNLFYYVYVLSFYEKAVSDRRFRKALKMLLLKTKNGEIIPENPHKAWRKYNFVTKGQPSELATARWREIELNLKVPK